MKDLPPQKTPRIRFATNAEGVLFLIFFFGLGGAGIYSGQNGLMLLFCCLFAAVWIFLFLARRNLSQPLRIERRFGQEIFAAQDARIDVLITNLGDYPIYGIHVFEQFSDDSGIGPMFIRKLNPGQTATAHYLCQFPKRGMANFSRFQVRSRFPAPFFEFRKDIEVLDMAYVYPEPIKGEEWISFFQGDSGHSSFMKRRNETTIRELVHGQKSGKILWKLSAKRRTWIEMVTLRSRRSSTTPMVMIVPKSQLGAEKYEIQVSQVTAYVLKQMQYELSGEIHSGHVRMGYGKSPLERRQVLEWLATV